MTLSKQERELINRLEDRLAKVEDQNRAIITQMNGIKKIVIGIAIGIGIGAVIFGFMSIKELLHLVK